MVACFKPWLNPIERQEGDGWWYVGGLDLSTTRNASAFAVVGVKRSHDDHALFRLAHLQAWHPSPGRKIDMTTIESEILGATRRGSI